MRNFLVSSALVAVVAWTQIALAARLSAVRNGSGAGCGPAVARIAGAPADRRLAATAHCAEDLVRIPPLQLHRVSIRAW